MGILLRKNIAQCDDRAARRPRDNRPAVGWVWTGRNLILDEALHLGSFRAVLLRQRDASVARVGVGHVNQTH